MQRRDSSPDAVVASDDVSDTKAQKARNPMAELLSGRFIAHLDRRSVTRALRSRRTSIIEAVFKDDFEHETPANDGELDVLLTKKAVRCLLFLSLSLCVCVPLYGLIRS